MGQGKRRRGLTILEKYEICKRRTESKENEKNEIGRVHKAVSRYINDLKNVCM